MSIFKPSRYCPKLRELDLNGLWEQGIRGLIVDIDNTLLAYGRKEPVEEDLNIILSAREMGFLICVISNNFKARVEPIAARLGIEFVASAKKPFPGGFRRALKLMGLEPSRAAMIGDQVLTDVLGANRLGIYTILVNPLSNRDFPATRLSRMIENIILGRLGIKRVY